MYTTKSDIENYLQRTLNTQESSLVENQIKQATYAIEAYLNRQWLSVGETIDDIESSTREYDGNSKKELFVDDFMALSKIEFDLMEFTSDDEWVLYPLNATVKNSIKLEDYRFPRDFVQVEITAKWTSGELPSDIRMVATELASSFINNKSSTSAFKKESIEGYSYERGSFEDSHNQKMSILTQLDHYKKRSL